MHERKTVQEHPYAPTPDVVASAGLNQTMNPGTVGTQLVQSNTVTVAETAKLSEPIANAKTPNPNSTNPLPQATAVVSNGNMHAGVISGSAGGGGEVKPLEVGSANTPHVQPGHSCPP